MSNIDITFERITSIQNHPNADRLEVAKLLGAQVIVSKGTYKVGDLVTYFPPDMLIPASVANELGVANYLKHAIYPGDLCKTPCRIAAARIRGVASYGFIAPLPPMPETLPLVQPGFVATTLYNGHKYEPPVKVRSGDAESEHPKFHGYTSIQNYYWYPDAIPPGIEVVVTEKLHGTNSRMGYVGGKYMCGSHNVNRKPDSLYWKHLDTVAALLLDMSRRHDASVIIFGEIVGSKVQDLAYGHTGAEGYYAFDISIDGTYLNSLDFLRACGKFGVPTAKILAQGPYSHELVTTYTDGPSLHGVHIREGIIIKPTTEAYSDLLQGRMILKSKSADFLGRNGAQDNA